MEKAGGEQWSLCSQTEKELLLGVGREEKGALTSSKYLYVILQWPPSDLVAYQNKQANKN